MTEGQILNRLAALGDSADVIADRLFKLLIRGRMGSACDCPLSNYLDSRGSILVHSTEVETLEDDGARKYVALPAPHQDFVRRFDKEEYPRLIRSKESV
jgi:hypothetical protein